MNVLSSVTDSNIKLCHKSCDTSILQHLPRNLFSTNMSSQWEFALITVLDLLGTDMEVHPQQLTRYL